MTKKIKIFDSLTRLVSLSLKRASPKGKYIATYVCFQICIIYARERMAYPCGNAVGDNTYARVIKGGRRDLTVYI